jgi:two-component system CheB/CheR fusion protein
MAVSLDDTIISKPSPGVRQCRPSSKNLTHREIRTLPGRSAAEVLRTLVFQEREIQTLEARWYLMRIVPYRRSDDVIDGVVITFLDIHEQKTACEKIPELSRKFQNACRYAESIITTVREPFVVLDKSLQIVSANQSFYEFFKVSPRQAEGRRIYDFDDRQWNIPCFRQLLEQTIPQNHSLDGVHVEHDFASIGRRKMMGHACRIGGGADGEDLILLAFEDVTGK